jgi:hypothetical protein
VKPFLKGQKNDFRDAEAIAGRRGYRLLHQVLPEILGRGDALLSPRRVRVIGRRRDNVSSASSPPAS